jgi:SulP family sulfate permease
VQDATSSFTRIPDLAAPALAIGVAAALLISSRFAPKVPLAMVMVAGATLVANILNLDVVRIGEMPARIGNFDLNFLNQSNIFQLLIPAIAVAVLAALESLLSAKVADGLRGNGERHDSNRELFGQGLANLFAPLFGGVAATAALARTAVNVKSNANSKLSAFSHSIFLAIAVLFFAPLVAQIPLAALAGVLLATMLHVIKPTEVMITMRNSKLDAIVFTVTFAATVFADLISAVVIGTLLWLVLRKTKLADLSRRVPSIDAAETLGD